MSEQIKASDDPFAGLLPTQKSLLRVDEAAGVFRCGQDVIYALIDEGKLEVHQGAGRRSHYRITRRSLLLHLARTAKYDPDSIADQIVVVVRSLPITSRENLIKKISEL